MRKAVQLFGLLLVATGVSGTIDHLAVQPVFGFLNVVNRVVIPRVDVLAGYELYANLSLAVLGVAVVVAAERTKPSWRPGAARRIRYRSAESDGFSPSDLWFLRRCAPSTSPATTPAPEIRRRSSAAC